MPHRFALLVFLVTIVMAAPATARSPVDDIALAAVPANTSERPKAAKTTKPAKSSKKSKSAPTKRQQRKAR